MNKVAETYGRVKNFLGEVNTELHKCSWPTREELTDSTVVVIVSVVLLGLYVGLSDVVSSGLLKILIR